MIRLDVADYCQQCDKFRSAVSAELRFADGDVIPYFTVRCKNHDLCESIKEYLERKDENNGKSHDSSGAPR